MADLVLFDGRNCMFRSAWANRSLSTTIGGVEVPTGSIYGTLQLVLQLAHLYEGRAEVCWESTKGNWRRRAYPAYKAHRTSGEVVSHGMTLPEAVASQQERLVGILSAAGVRQWRPEDGECDDALATRAREATEAGETVVIVSGDWDLAQCVTDDVHVHSPSSKGPVLYTPHEVAGLQGNLPPDWVPDVKALAGDSSDNLPGCRGIGDARAVSLLVAHGRVEDLIRKAETSDVVGKIGEKIRDQKEMILLCKRLATVDVDAVLEAIEPSPDEEVLAEMLDELGMDSFLKFGRFKALTEVGRDR